jgi:CheY-like chemotaxis protein
MASSSYERSSSTSKTSVLLVEDDPFTVAYVGNCLTSAGMTVTTAANGKEALALLETSTPDLIITDLNMPVMDGCELIARLSTRPTSPPVIVLTGSGLDAFPVPDNIVRFEKPVNCGALVSEVRRLFDHAAGRVRGISLAGLLQVLNWERKSCMLVVRHAGVEGRLFVNEGKLADAQVRDTHGLDAALDILRWDGAEIELHSAERRPETIRAPLMEVVMESARLKDEALLAAHDPAAGLERMAQEIAGALFVGVVDIESARLLGSYAPSNVIDPGIAAESASSIFKSQRKLLAAVKSTSPVDDILVTLSDQVHLIRTVSPSTLLYVIADRAHTNLAIARTVVARHAPGLGANA